MAGDGEKSLLGDLRCAGDMSRKGGTEKLLYVDFDSKQI